uniref:Uncharacterized protein n=1 Tax=Janibacter limosus TaxID=53458 RepID=A0AC61U3E6_9MICO
MKMCPSAWASSWSPIWRPGILICSTGGRQQRDHRVGAAGLGGGRRAGQAPGCPGQVGVEHGRVGAAAVADRGQPLAQPGGREPVGALLGIEAGDEGRADLGVEVGEQAHRAGEDDAQVGAQLVGGGDPVGHEVLAGAAGAAQRRRGPGVRLQSAQPGPVGAQGVGEHERVEAVVLVAGRAVPAAQVLDSVGADHHHRQFGLEEDVDDRPVGSFDGDLIDAVLGREDDRVAQAGRGVFDHDALFRGRGRRRCTRRGHPRPNRCRP